MRYHWSSLLLSYVFLVPNKLELLLFACKYEVTMVYFGIKKVLYMPFKTFSVGCPIWKVFGNSLTPNYQIRLVCSYFICFFLKVTCRQTQGQWYTDSVWRRVTILRPQIGILWWRDIYLPLYHRKKSNYYTEWLKREMYGF